MRNWQAKAQLTNRLGNKKSSNKLNNQWVDHHYLEKGLTSQLVAIKSEGLEYKVTVGMIFV